MRRVALMVVGCVVGCPLSAGWTAEVSAGVSLRGGEVESFQLDVKEHYGASEAEMAAIRKARLKDDEVAVALHIARRARRSPSLVVEMRTGGKSWTDISAHFGLGAEIFHVEVEGDCGPPYGRALGHYKNRQRHQWGSIRLSDDEVVLLVNLDFVSKRAGCSAAEVVRMGSGGGSAVALHARVQTQKRLRAQARKGSGAAAGAAAKGPGGNPSASSSRGSRASSGSGQGGGRGKAAGSSGSRASGAGKRGGGGGKRR